ncbi:2-alkenal reductase (NADP(+)-dependent) [Sphaceloma murrayae]|uniref:2-alkenal reductase (NADP(+)-dependent) n=1 Tax=Sphaceloma murrayae TaxID=2082308 RepID=A0A2K1QI18_9PEZI|nr:2-alkenal reductase (NADP(+)-dependent) [Sphaceloma murrayae]
MADIAVIGMGCRFPGDAKSPSEFYNMLLKGRSGWSEVPKDRFNIDAYWHPSYDRKGTIVCRGAHFLSEDVGLFDAPFCMFNVLLQFSAEASSMDPQHRMLLEITYETLENAGIPMGSIVGSDMGCYVGGFTREYDTVCATDLNDTLLYTTTGNGLTMMSNRLSWFYDLHGPSLTLDTACSSSLVALSLAVQNIRSSNSERRQALVAGSNLILVPDQMTTMNPLHFLSPDSQCYSFDDRANGYVRGEGVGVILLKHIDDAIRDGDCIRAVIRNVVCNQDGKTPGITLPSSEAQISLIRKAYGDAGLDMNETGYFEAHGTGTAAGDPLEVSAIAAAFDRAQEGRSPLLIGSVKPNIGHLEAGAGMAGLIKTILSLEAGFIPGNILFENSNPRLGLAERNLKVVQGPTPWPTAGLRRASVNSFGYGGTNGHAIIDDAQNYLGMRGISNRTRTRTLPGLSRSSSDSGFISDESGDDLSRKIKSETMKHMLYVLSTPDQAALPRLAALHAKYVQDHIDIDGNSVDAVLEDLAFTYGKRRTTFQWRKALVAQSAPDLVSKLQDETKPTRAGKEPNLLFCFTGQGAQWYCMGRELLSHEMFYHSVASADKYLASIGADWRVLTEFTASEEDSKINSPYLSQPLCTVLQVALVDLLRHWNISPKGVVGHSSGEIAAAYALGALSAEDCWKIAYHRGRLAQEFSSRHPDLRGGMLAVGLSRDDTEQHIKDLGLSAGQVLGVACVNSAESVTVSGDLVCVEQLEASLKSRQIFARKLAVKNAYHSQHMELLAEDYRRALVDVKVRPVTTGVTMYSSVTGAPVTANDLHGEYWVQNMVCPVLFDAAVQAALHPAKGSRRRGKVAAINTILELGPHAALAGPLRQILARVEQVDSVSYLSALRRKEDAQATALAAAGVLWSTGAKVDVEKVNNLTIEPADRIPLVDLPKYPWNHTVRYWQESSLSKSLRFRHSPRTDLLGEPIREFTWSEPTWKNVIQVSEQPWLSDHVVRGNDVYPAAAMICAAIEGVKQCATPGKIIKSFDLRDVIINRALIIPADDPGVEVFTRLRPQRHGIKGTTKWYDFNFTSLEGSTGIDRKYAEHCSGQVCIVYHDASEASVIEIAASNAADRKAFDSAEGASTQDISSEEHYAAVEKIGITYGSTFQGLKSIKAGDGRATFEIELCDTKSLMPAEFEFPFVLHPTLLDAAIQSAYQGLTHDRTATEDDTVVPTEFRRMRVSAKLPTAAGTRLAGFVHSEWISAKDCTATIKLGHKEWPETLLELGDCVFMGLGDANTRTDSTYLDRRLATKYCWKPSIDLIDPTGADFQGLVGKDVEPSADIGKAKAVCTQAAFIFIRRTVEKLDSDAESALTGHWVPYVEWLKEKYEDGKAGRLFGQTAASENWCHMTIEREEQFLAEAEIEHPDDIKLTCAVGRVLPAIVAGDQQPLPIMLVDDMLSKFYADAFGMTSGLYMFRDLFDHLGHKNPNMHILEIGAGTGSVTKPIMHILGGQDGRTPRFGTYTFTDITSGWFAKAQEFLKPWEKHVKYQKLDIEGDVLEQGFQPESFDIIAASNVLHATKRLDVTLRNCYKLLKPGGKMVIGELTACPDHSGLIFGTLPGWWLSEDGRKGGPMITQEQWHKQLQECQFSGLDMAVAAEDSEGTKILSTMVSTKPAEPVAHHLQEAIVVKPLVESEVASAILKAVETKFEAAGVDVTLVSLAEAAGLADQDALRAKQLATICLVEAQDPIFARPTKDVFEQTRKIIVGSNALFWYACNNDEDGVAPPEACAISGLLRTARSENPLLRLHEAHLQCRPAVHAKITAEKIWRITELFWNTKEDDEFENEVYEANGHLTTPRLIDEEPLNKMIRNLGRQAEPEEQRVLQKQRPLRLRMAKNSKIESLYFSDDEEAAGDLPTDFVEIEVKANGVNSSDIATASGKRPGLVLGIDAAGIVSRVGSAVNKFKPGDRVALAQLNAFRTHVRLSQDYLQLIPDHISLEQAAAFPFVFMAAYQGLIEMGRLRKGDRVLINRAATSLGQALVTLAQSVGADVFAAAGTTEKRNFLKERFGLDPDHVLDSGSSEQNNTILRLTDSNGVDVAVNLASGDALSTLSEVVTPFGRLVNFNLEDVEANAPIRLRNLGKNVSLMSVDMKAILEKAPERASHLMKEVFTMLRAKTVQPVKQTSFNYSKLQEAFSTAQNPDNIGKIVLKLDDSSKAMVVPHDAHPLELTADSTYVLSGGMGGIGRALACYLADHGARNIVLLSRSTDVTGKAVATMDYLKSLDVNVKIIPCDVTNRSNVQRALDIVKSDMPPIKGAVLGAMVLRDGLYENMTYEQWVECTRPKIEGTWNLHELLPRDLDFFIMLSSIAGICGNPGQPNYAAGNSYQDAMCHYRRSLGLAATTIDVGGVGGFGWLNENKGGTTFAEVMSNLMIQPTELFTMFKSAVTGYTSYGNECPTQLVTGIGSGGMSDAHVAAGGRDSYFWLDRQGRFAYLRQLDVAAESSDSSTHAVAGVKKALATATSMAEAETVVLGALTAKLAKSLLIAPEDIDTGLPISSYGVDSLVAADLRNWCAQEVKSVVSVFEFLNAVPIVQLAGQIAAKSELVPEAVERGS